MNGFTRRGLLALALACSAVSGAVAQSYPAKPVRIVVAYPPGGATDVIARKLAQKLTEQTGQSFFVENKPGATGTIGVTQVANAAPDGYTLLAIENTFSIYPFVFKSLPFDHAKALKPISSLYMVPVLLAAKNDSSGKTLADVIAAAKKDPDTVTFGSGGNGSAPHFAGELFQQVAGVTARHIPYKGAGDAMTGLIGSQIDLLFVSTPSAAAQIKGGRIRALAVSGESRVAGLDAVPTFEEAGLPGFSAFNWTGIAAPANTPADIVAKLNAEIVKALESADMKAFAETLNAQPGPRTPDSFAALIRDETARWAPIAQKAGIEKQ